MRKYLRVLFQNSMRGRKERFKLSCSLFAIMALSLIAVFTLAANPVAGGVLLSGLGLMAFIDESTLDDDQKKFFKGLDDKLEELNVKFLKDELGKPEYLKQINDLINEFKQLNEKNMSDKIDKKDFENFKKELLGLAVINDSINEPKPELIEALKSKNAKVMLWSKRGLPEFRDMLKAS